MAGMVTQLIEILNEQAERYGELLGLSLEKRDVIIANDVESLQKITHLENLVISQNQKLETKRIAFVKDMALVLDRKADELTLTALVDLLDEGEEKDKLAAARDRIKETIEELGEVNKQNGALINNALEYAEYSLNVLRSSIDKTPAYFTGKGEAHFETPGFIDARN
jgi:flagellar biosynthesis/type III secretory pathway chaperone